MQKIVDAIEKTGKTEADLPKHISDAYKGFIDRTNAYNTKYDQQEAMPDEDVTEEMVGELQTESDAIDALEDDIASQIDVWHKEELAKVPAPAPKAAAPGKKETPAPNATATDPAKTPAEAAPAAAGQQAASEDDGIGSTLLVVGTLVVGTLAFFAFGGVNAFRS